MMDPGAAATAATSSQVGIWFFVFAQIASLGASLVMVAAFFKTQKRQVEVIDTAATKPELAKVEEQLDAKITKVDLRVNRTDSELADLKDSIVRNGETRRQSIEAKIDGVRKELKLEIASLDIKANEVKVQVGGVERETRLFNQQLIQITDHLGRIADRVPAGRGAAVSI